MSGSPASIPEHWIMCKMASRFRASVAHFRVEGEGEDEETKSGGAENDLMPMSKVVERIDGSAVEGEWYVLPLAITIDINLISRIVSFAF